MDILHLRCLLFFWLNLLEIFADQIPSQWRNSHGLMCTFSDGQRCTENIQQNTTVARDGWKLQRAPSESGDYFARVACSQPCQDSVTVLQDVQGSLQPMLLSFYYSIWTLSSLDPSPPALSIYSCSDDPNWNSKIDLSDSISPQWRGAVISLLCKETFNVSFVASVSSANQGVVIDNIAMPFKFTTKGILNRPSYEIPAPLGMTDGPIDTTDKMAPDVSVTSSTVTEMIGYGPISTDVTYESYNGVPYRTLAMSDGLNRNIENHVAYKPAIIMLFILIVCSTTVIIHLLICKNQRTISSRLRRVSASVSPPGDEQRKVSPEVYVTSYSSTNTASEPRTVSFVSQSGEEFPEEEEDEKGNKKSETKEAAKRRMSIACMERLSKPSKLRPHGRANTTPTNPKDALYESIDGGSEHVAEESVSKRLLRKISPSKLPRFLENARSSSSDIQKNTNKDIASSNSSSLLSVTFDPSTRNNRKSNGNCLTPPLPPRTYPIGERAADAKKSNSTSQLAPKKGTTSSLSAEGRLPPKVQVDRRWSDINVGGITISKKTVNNQSRAVSECKEADSWSLVSRETLVEKQDDRQQTTDGDAEHGYYVLQRPRNNSTTISDDMTDARSIDTKSIESENGSHNYHILERGLEVDYSSSVDVESIGDGSSLVESNAYQSLGGSLCSHHTYQSLEQQESIAMSDESFEKDITPSLNRQSNICFGDTLSRRALIAQTKFREGGIDEKIVDDNNGYSIPIVQKVRDGNIPSDYNSRDYRCTQSSLGSTKERDCASVTSETSGYNQLMRKDCNLAIESETESSGGYDHIKR